MVVNFRIWNLYHVHIVIKIRHHFKVYIFTVYINVLNQLVKEVRRNLFSSLHAGFFKTSINLFKIIVLKDRQSLNYKS